MYYDSFHPKPLQFEVTERKTPQFENLQNSKASIIRIFQSVSWNSNYGGPTVPEEVLLYQRF